MMNHIRGSHIEMKLQWGTFLQEALREARELAQETGLPVGLRFNDDFFVVEPTVKITKNGAPYEQ